MSFGSTIDELLAHQHWEDVGSNAGGVDHPTQPTELLVASSARESSARVDNIKYKI